MERGVAQNVPIRSQWTFPSHVAPGALGGQVWACGWRSACGGPAFTLSPVWNLGGESWGAGSLLSRPHTRADPRGLQVTGGEMYDASWPPEGGLGVLGWPRSPHLPGSLGKLRLGHLTASGSCVEGHRGRAGSCAGAGPRVGNVWPSGRLPAEAAAGSVPGLTSLITGVLEHRTACPPPRELW